jgi:hypothetical protein
MNFVKKLKKVLVGGLIELRVFHNFEDLENGHLIVCASAFMNERFENGNVLLLFILLLKFENLGLRLLTKDGLGLWKG